MRMTGRVKEIIEINQTDHCIPLVVLSEPAGIFPMYFASIRGENTLVFPATNATDISQALGEGSSAMALVADREGGYEAYSLEGHARYVTQDADYMLVSALQNLAPGFPVHGAVIFDVERVHLLPPP
jgi:hypothetical protein